MATASMMLSKTMLLAQARALWRRRWYAVMVAWAFCLVGWIYVAFMPNIFEAKTRIYVDTDSMLRPLMHGIAIDPNMLSVVDIMQRTLLSRPNLLKVIHMADLDLGASGPTATEDLLKDLRKRVTVTNETQNLFTLTYTGPDRSVATKVIQSLLTVFVESNLGNSRQDMVSAQTFIDQQLSGYARQLDEAEKRIADFKAKNVGFLPGEENYSTKLDQAKQELGKTQAQLDDELKQREELKKQIATVPQVIDTVSAGPFGTGYGSGPPLGGGGGGATGSSTAVYGPDPAARVAQLETKLEDLKQNFTDQYPDVVRLKRQIAQAKQDADAAAKAAAKAAAANGSVDPRAVHTTAPNPVYEQLTLKLVSLDTDIASLKARLARNQAEIQHWQGLAKSVPEVGAQMAKLTRDYDVIKKSYNELLNRKEAAKIGNDLATQTQTVQFRVIDPPDAPPVPVAPHRILLYSAVLGAAIVAGAAFAFFLSQIDDSVKTLSELREIFAVPVLGAISVVMKPEHKRRNRMRAASFVLTCLTLVVAYVGILSAAILTQPHV